MGALAVALARECYFGEDVMRWGSVGGRGRGTTLPHYGIRSIRRVIFSMCPSYHNDTQRFEEIVWRKCKDALNHACNKYRCSPAFTSQQM